jgi:hypothetical protein
VGRDDHLAVGPPAWEAPSNVVDDAYAGRKRGGLRYTAALDPRGLLRLELAEATKAVASGDAQS